MILGEPEEQEAEEMISVQMSRAEAEAVCDALAVRASHMEDGARVLDELADPDGRFAAVCSEVSRVSYRVEAHGKRQASELILAVVDRTSPCLGVDAQAFLMEKM